MRAVGTLASAFMVNLVTVNAVAATEAWHEVHGWELHWAIADRELADGVHYAYQLHADGTLTGLNIGKAVSGNWRTTPDAFCWTWVRPALDEECFTVERNSANLRFVRDGIEIHSGELGSDQDANV